jgi:integrase
MPRLTNSVPKYRKHKASGQAVVTIGGKDHYLGPHKSKASKLEYDRLIGEWVQNGRKLPSDGNSDTTIVELVAAYWKFAQGYYVKNGRKTDELASIRVALKYLRESYGDTQAAKFGPLSLKTIRQRMVDAGSSRDYVNKLVARIRRCFKWGCENEMVPVAVHQSLMTVAGLAKGKTEARETDPVLPVDEVTVDTTIPQLPPIVADMVRLQRLAGMRPEEVCMIRPADIDRSGDVWSYVPKTHKMEHKDRQRIIFLGPQAQAILTPYLLRAEDQVCFVPKRKGADEYSTRSYRDAIHRACDRAKIDHWSPNQLRHAAATEIRKRYGLEGAQVALGHSNANVTQIYAERDTAKAIEIMREVG